jgi:hypothetical protein
MIRGIVERVDPARMTFPVAETSPQVVVVQVQGDITRVGDFEVRVGGPGRQRVRSERAGRW